MFYIYGENSANLTFLRILIGFVWAFFGFFIALSISSCIMMLSECYQEPMCFCIKFILSIANYIFAGSILG
jgi:hypothetical protein